MHRTMIIASLVLTASSAQAQQPSADCEGWTQIVDWPLRAAYVSAETTLEQMQDGVFVAIDVSYASTFAASGGQIILSSPFAFTLANGTYRVRTRRTIYDGATSALSPSATATWPAADTHGSSSASSDVICASGRPSFSISPPGTWTRGQVGMIEPALSLPSGWTEAVRFSLASAPGSMSIDEETGEVSWTPGASDLGRRTVIIALESGGQILDVEAFEILVVAP